MPSREDGVQPGGSAQRGGKCPMGRVVASRGQCPAKRQCPAGRPGWLGEVIGFPEDRPLLCLTVEGDLLG